MTITSLLSALEAGEVTSRRAVEHVFDRATAQTELNAFITLDREGALATADEADVARRSGHTGPLLGVPIAVKDNIVTRGVPTSAGSKILDGFVSPYDATVVAKLKAAGAVLIGKTNLDEFGMGSTNEHSAFGPVRHPTIAGAVPGGSSGGSAAAVAAGIVPAALGSDTGGSIRQPASLTGIVGLKPTYGRVSRFGLIAYASSLDQIGPMTHTVEDAALVFDVIAGHDPRDATSATNKKQDIGAALASADLQGKRVGVVTDYFGAGLADDVRESVEKELSRMEAAGAELVEVGLPHLQHAVATYYILATAEASSNLSRYDGLRYGHRAQDPDTLDAMYEMSRGEGFGHEVKKRIMLGTYVLSAGYYDAYYRKAQKVRTLIKADFEAALGKVDVLATPVTPKSVFTAGEANKDPLSIYLADVLTVSANLAGVPALVLPCKNTPSGVPIGLQLMGKWFDEASVLAVGHALEKLGGVS